MKYFNVVVHGFGRWVGGCFFVARGTVLEPFVAVEYVVLKCCEEVLSWLKTFLPSSSLTDLPHAQFCKFDFPFLSHTVLVSKGVPGSLL
jgi:hypothetical protein